MMMWLLTSTCEKKVSPLLILLLYSLKVKVCKTMDPVEQGNKTDRCVEAIAKPANSHGIICRPYDKEKGICRLVLHDEVVAGTAYERNSLEAKLQRFEDGLKFVRLYNLSISRSCKNTIYDVYCRRYFPACDLTTTVVLKQPVCKESCYLVFKACDKELFQFGPAIYNSPYEVMNCSKLPNKNAGDSPVCYYHPNLNSKLDKMQSTSCYYGNGLGYIGNISVTRTGSTCQPWSSQCPHRHIHKPEKYRELMNASNLCRNPGGEGPDGPWCYTTNSSTRWEYCDIPKCPNPVPAQAPVLFKAVALNETAIVLTWTPVTMKFVRGYLITLYSRAEKSKRLETKTLEKLVKYGKLLNATVTDLQPQTNYSVNISAFTEYGRGPSSNILTVLTPARLLDTHEADSQTQSQVGLLTGVTISVIIFVASVAIFFFTKCWRSRQQEISPYACVTINNWLTVNLNESSSHQIFHGNKIAMHQNDGVFESKLSLSSDIKLFVSQLYANLDSEGRPLAGEFAGTFDFKCFYANLNRRYQNVDFRGLPLGGEFRLLAYLNEFTEKTTYNRLLRKCGMRRNSLGKITEEGMPMYDKLFHGYPSVKRSLFLLKRRSFHDFGCLSRNQSIPGFPEARRNSIS